MLKLDELKQLTQECEALTLRRPYDYTQACQLLSDLRALLDQAAEDKERTIRPLKTAYDNAKRPFDTAIKDLTLYVERLVERMERYDLARARELELAHAKACKAVETRNQRLMEKARKLGAELMLEKVPEPGDFPKSITLTNGVTITRRDTVHWDIAGLTPEQLEKISADDPRLASIPREYLTVNVRKISKDVLGIEEGKHPPFVSVRPGFIYQVKRANASEESSAA